jgi:hypothetical protein
MNASKGFPAVWAAYGQHLFGVGFVIAIVNYHGYLNGIDGIFVAFW